MGTSTAGPNLTVLRALGGDRVSEAFLASVPGFDTPKAVRVLKPDLAADQARAELFLAEARRLMGARHPNLLAVHGAGRMLDGRVYAVTDFVEGQPLEQVPRGGLKVEALVDAGIRLCGALEAVHKVGGAHGALCGRHVLWTEGGPQLDFTFASVERQGAATAEGDAQALAAALLEAATPEGGVPPFEAALKASLAASKSPAALAQGLDSLRSRWKERTAVSSPSVKAVSRAQAEAAPQEPNLAGETLGNYEVVSLLGEGAMGRVYRGRHARIGRTAAIKVLRAEHAQSRDLVARFIQEAQAVNAIKNPHIVDIYDFGEEALPGGDRRVYCILELLEGESLADLMDREPLTVRLATKVAFELAQALGAAHHVGVVHRDIKPDNIFLARREKDPHYVKVLDFGVAKLLKPIGDLPRAGTQAGVVIGTPEYMAPEQALGQTTDSRVDLYAVGLVLYEILAGQRPFAGETFGKLVVEITSTPTPPLPAATPRGEPIPRALAAVVYRCLEKDADRRFPSAEALADALSPFAQGLAVEASAPAASAPAHDELAAVRPSRAPMVAAGALALLLLGAVAWLALPGGARPAATAAPPARSVAPPPASTAPAAPAQMVLKLRTTPAGATVTRLDTGEVLGRTSAVAGGAGELKLELDRKDQTLALKFELEGRPPRTREVSLAENTTIDLDLPAVEAAPAPLLPAPKKPERPKR